MFDSLEVFRMAGALARHSAARQGEVAANVANADTPGFRARDVAPFATLYDRADRSGDLRATRPGHLTGTGSGTGGSDAAAVARIDAGGAADPNGNTVSLEAEMIRAVEVQHAHETALSVYESARNILRTSLGRGR